MISSTCSIVKHAIGPDPVKFQAEIQKNMTLLNIREDTQNNCPSQDCAGFPFHEELKKHIRACLWLDVLAHLRSNHS
jgi:hypothetical protein